MTIKEIRLKTGLSQSGFAGKYNIPIRTLQQWEQGISHPAPYVTDMLARLSEEEAGSNTIGKKSYISGLSIDPIKTWQPAPFEDYRNINSIHPLQRKKVGRLISLLLQDSSVKRIVIFGSSVTENCHIGSDVDVYTELTDDHIPDCAGLDFTYDLWTNFSADDRLKKEIEKKGVTVYVN